MNILHFVDSLSAVRGGPVRAVLDLASGAAGAGHAATVATLDESGAPPDAGRTPGVRMERLSGGPAALGRMSRPARARFAELVRAADVVHLHGVWELATAQAARIARSAGVPYVLSTHGMLDRWPLSHNRARKRAYLTLIGRRLLKRAACIHCTAPVELEESRRWFGGAPSRVIPLVLDLYGFRDLPGPEAARRKFPALSTGRPVALFLGRLDPIKNLESLVEAAAILKNRGTDCTIVLAGPAEPTYGEALRNLATTRGIGDRVSFIGPVFGPDKVSLYQAADVFVLPSLHENFGLVAFEALAAGLPVVVTKGVGSWPALEASGGSVVSSAAPAAMADAMATALDGAAGLGLAGRAWVLATLDGPAVIREYLDMYADAARRRG